MRLVVRVDTTDDAPTQAGVTLQWDGQPPTLFGTNGNGRLVLTIGPFDQKSITVSIVRLTHPDYVYMPKLNEDPTTLEFESPDDD